MKQATSSSFRNVLDDIGDAFAQVMRFGAKAVASVGALPWPALLAASLVLAFAITIVPLALMLFIGFLLVKLGVNALANRRQRHGE